MSRLAKQPPTGKMLIVAKADDHHEVYYLEPIKIGDVFKRDDGWQTPDKKRFDQEQQAIRELWTQKGRDYNKDIQAVDKGPKIRLHEVTAGQPTMKLAGFSIDTRMAPFNEYTCFRTLTFRDKVIVEATKAKNQIDREKPKAWIKLAENTPERAKADSPTPVKKMPKKK